MLTFEEQVREAFDASPLSVAELLELSGLDMDRSTLQRKIDGEYAWRGSELERVATALKVTLTFPNKRRRRKVA